MISARTARALSAELSACCKQALRAACGDLHISAAQLALWVGVNKSLTEDWLNAESARHVPVYVLAHPKIPEALRARIASDVLALVQESCPKQSRETATNLLLGVAGDAVAALARALADGHVEDHEVRSLRPVIASLRDRCDRWLRDHAHEATPSLRGVV